MAAHGCRSDTLLSSFLPQDKVADFAKMQPDVVLRETMRAAGDPRLTDWHEKLVQKGAKLRETESVRNAGCYLAPELTFDPQDLGPNIDKRNNLQQSVNRMEPDVRRFHEREERQMQASDRFPRSDCQLINASVSNAQDVHPRIQAESRLSRGRGSQKLARRVESKTESRYAKDETSHGARQVSVAD